MNPSTGSTRSAMFLASDIMSAAETAAMELSPHLLPEQINELAQELTDFMHDWMRIVREESA